MHRAISLALIALLALASPGSTAEIVTIAGTGRDEFLGDNRGRDDPVVWVAPPSEPDGRVSRIRLSG